MYAARLALRYLFARRIHLVGIAGIFVGVTALVVVLSVMNGFIQETRRAVRGTLADAIVTPHFGERDDPVPYEPYASALAATPGVAGSAPRLVWYGLLSTGDVRGDLVARASGGPLNAVQLVGLDPVAEKEVTRFGESLRSPSLVGDPVDDPEDPFAPPLAFLLPEERDLPRPTVIVGEQLFDMWRLRKGKTIDLATFTWDSEEKKVLTHNRRFTVAGTFRTGEYEYDLRTIYLRREDLAEELLGTPQSFSEIVVRLAGEVSPERAVSAIEDALAGAGVPGTWADCGLHRDIPPDEVVERDGRLQHAPSGGNGGTSSCGREVRRNFFTVETWRERKGVLLAAIDNEKRIMAVILFFIVVVATFLLFALLYTTVQEKTRDIGIVAALGGTRRGILSIFLCVGMAITAIGEALGLAAGLAITGNLQAIERFLREEFGLVIFRPDVYIFDHLPCEVDPLGVAAILAATFFCALNFTSIPAWMASRKEPVRALRYE
jgi:lipoprotein-releasing system permease protein